MEPKKQAENTLTRYVAVGLALGVIGGVIMGATWPHTEVSLFGDIEQKGSGLGLAFGAFIAWFGNMMLFVGLVGWGVKFGREASHQGPAPQPGGGSRIAPETA